MIFAAKALSALDEVWQFLGFRGAVALALLIALPVHGCMERRSGFQDGKESVLAELKAAEAEALKKAATAARKADKAGEERALIEAEARAEDIAAIERAVEAETNPLDAIF